MWNLGTVIGVGLGSAMGDPQRYRVRPDRGRRGPAAGGVLVGAILAWRKAPFVVVVVAAAAVAALLRLAGLP